MSPEEERFRKHAVLSGAVIGKRPLHPILVDFPIAFLTAALLTDLLYFRTGAAQWADFSFWLILAGWLSGLLSVATGLIDFLSSERARTLSTGWLHFLATDLAIFISTFNLIERLSDHQGAVLFVGWGLLRQVLPRKNERIGIGNLRPARVNAY